MFRFIVSSFQFNCFQNCVQNCFLCLVWTQTETENKKRKTLKPGSLGCQPMSNNVKQKTTVSLKPNETIWNHLKPSETCQNATSATHCYTCFDRLTQRLAAQDVTSARLETVQRFKEARSLLRALVPLGKPDCSFMVFSHLARCF